MFRLQQQCIVLRHNSNQSTTMKFNGKARLIALFFLAQHGLLTASGVDDEPQPRRRRAGIRSTILSSLKVDTIRSKPKKIFAQDPNIQKEADLPLSHDEDASSGNEITTTTSSSDSPINSSDEKLDSKSLKAGSSSKSSKTTKTSKSNKKTSKLLKSNKKFSKSPKSSSKKTPKSPKSSKKNSVKKARGNTF